MVAVTDKGTVAVAEVALNNHRTMGRGIPAAMVLRAVTQAVETTPHLLQAETTHQGSLTGAAVVEVVVEAVAAVEVAVVIRNLKMQET